MNDTTRFHHNVARSASSLHFGFKKLDIPLFPSSITLANSFWRVHGLKNSQYKGLVGPREPTKVGDVDVTENLATNL